MSFLPVTLGTKLRSTHVNGLLLTETLHGPGTRLDAHAHEYAAITFVISGAFTESFGGTDYECQAFNVLFKPAGVTHTNAYHGGARSFIIELQPEWISSRHIFGIFDEYASHLCGGIQALLALRLYETFSDGVRGIEMGVEELVFELVRGAELKLGAVDKLSPPCFLTDVRGRVEASFSDDISLSTLAADVGVHPVYLARVFRKHYGCSIGNYVRRRRIDHAADQLARTDVPASRLALQLGYYDQSHFNRAFKVETGMTPVAYRRRARRLAL